jgi:hypothetical protein
MRRLPLLLAGLLSLNGCVKHLIVNSAADALAGGDGPGWGADDDPELIAGATPFALKTIEGLLGAEPENPKLLQAACSGFTQYGYGFVWGPAELNDDLKDADKTKAKKRTIRLLNRSNGYCWKGLEAKHEGFGEAWKKDHAAALKMLEKEDVPLVYWTAATLALRISLQKDQPALVAQLSWVGDLAERALALDETWGQGSLHEFLQQYEEARPAAAGGSVAKAKAHREAALKLSENKKLGPLVAWAEDVDVSTQDRKEFDALLNQVLAFDVDSAPDFRLSNIVAQRRAAWIKSHTDDYFP